MNANKLFRSADRNGMSRGMHAGWFALLLPVLVAQATYTRLTTPRLPVAAGPDEGEIPGRYPALRFLALGESTVAGVGAATQEQALTCQCARWLRDLTGRAVCWKAVGLSGGNARSLLVRMRTMERVEADLALVVLGVNDVVAFRAPAKWAQDLTSLVLALRERSGNIPVLLAGVPPVERFTALPQPLRDCLGRRARVLDREARQLVSRLPGLSHCQTPLPRPDHLAEDGFHPSPAGYSGWAWVLAHALATLARLSPDELVAERAAVTYSPMCLSGRHAA
ncbi:MAG: SGNH/GDSL hydrolase family protein [Desulfocurvibacter africanus]